MRRDARPTAIGGLLPSLAAAVLAACSGTAQPGDTGTGGDGSSMNGDGASTMDARRDGAGSGGDGANGGDGSGSDGVGRGDVAPLGDGSSGTGDGSSGGGDGSSGIGDASSFPPGAPCRTSADCAVGQICLSGHCAFDPCVGNSMCAVGQSCLTVCEPLRERVCERDLSATTRRASTAHASLAAFKSHAME